MTESLPSPEIRILVVDDDPDILKGTARVLEKAGYLTAMAATGEEALRALPGFGPDLVLLDRDLPNIDGVEVCRRIKHDPAHADVLVILISGTYTGSDEQIEGLESGADGYLVRPIANRELGARIAAYVRILRLTRSLREERRRLEASNAALGDAQRAALNLMEDAIAARDRAEAASAALQDSEERFRATFEQAAVGLAHVGTDGRWLRVNQRLCDIVGYCREELLQRTFQEITHPDDLDTDLAFSRQVLAGDIQTYSMEKRYLQKSGAPVWINLTVSLVRDRSGAPSHFISVIEDVSERRRTEVALAHSRAQLVQSQKLEAVGRLAGGVAHDFNNILQALLSLATVLRFKVGTPELARIVGEIDALVKRGAGLTQQLLLFSRRQMAEMKGLDLGEVTGSAAGLLRRLLPENIRLTVDTAPGPLWVNGDAGQLQQVLMNLAVNAKDAMPGGGTLTVRARGGDSEAVLEVADTGHGMDGETRAHLFEPFFTTKETGKGTGLGLSVVHGIVEQHGGRIEVESAPGQGSCFRVVLPLASAPGAAADSSDGAANVPGGHGERVLIVEDEDGARKGLAELLGILGFEVVAVGSGEEAGSLPAAPAPALLLTDLMLPGIDGATLAAGLRDRWPGLKVVLMSGYTEDEAVRRGVDEGSVHFLQKPFDVVALGRAVAAALAGGCQVRHS